ncbi:MAG: hypothetical protein Q9159_006876 [Coniocarpon cinnabarinum]
MSSPILPSQPSHRKTITLCVALALVVLSYYLIIARPPARDTYSLDASIFNATLGFGGIYAISLPSRTDHQDSLTLAAANTDLRIDFFDGLFGDAVEDHALPPDANRQSLGAGNIGSWRAHMNVIQHVVKNNLSSALILEDDVDWDVRIKPQLAAFAMGSRALTQPLTGGGYIDPTLSTRASADDVSPLNYDLTPGNAPTTTQPVLSPFGDNWDVLWLGHCGVRFPAPGQTIPKGRYIIEDDKTVPNFKVRNTIHDEVRQQYKDHTRAIHHAMGPICTFAYAVSQRGARRILKEIGIDSFHGPFDNVMAAFCDRHTCITSQPQYFSHWRPRGSENRDSDINAGSDAFREKGHSVNIRQSVKLNALRIIDGSNVLEDQYPD